MRVWLTIIALTIWHACLPTTVTAEEQLDPAAVEFFEKKVRPILVEHCLECHRGEEPKGGLRLDARSGWHAGGDSGPAIIPGKPDESLLIQAIRYRGDYEMPPKGKLPDSAIQVLEEWVRIGAPDPRSGQTDRPAKGAVDLETGRQHWSYRPIQSVAPPEVADSSWGKSAIDRFILAKLEASGLRPSEEATREVLVRRLYFDLLGLPPTPEEIDRFAGDPRPDAYERLVDELIASPHFGERWGRHWLDVARFAESLTLRGFIFKEAWRYRDYVISTLNDDRPYDQFLREQIAGDLLPAESLEEQSRNLIATSYLVMGNTNLEEQDKQQLEMDVVDEQLDVIGKGILAQTITCARCHDHKFDPIPTRDYYAMAGILKNVQVLEHANVSKWVEKPLPLEPGREKIYEEHAAKIAVVKAKIKTLQDAAKASADGTTAVDAILQPGELPGIVVDDTQAKRIGEWKHSQFSKRYIGDGYLHDLDQGKGERTLTFAPELPADGKYEVRFAYVSGNNRAAKVAVTVFSADGEKSIDVNQREPAPIEGRWVHLGQYRFERAGQSFVIVSNEGTKGHVVADAVQFLPVDAANVPTPASNSPKGTSNPAVAELKALEQQLKQLTAAAPYRPSSMSVLELSPMRDSHINIRGSVHQLGQKVDRGFLQVCGASVATIPPNESGRKELADWLVSPTNPLTARVIVNRLWYWTMGAGIVRTVDNFGTTGELPTHPELLDFLAARLFQADWSLKELIREIVLSGTYRQSSGGLASGMEGVDSTEAFAAGSATVAGVVDPENRLLGRMNRRRLDAESLRDAMLSISGDIDYAVSGPGFPAELAADYGFVHTSRRRSIYAPVFRNSPLEIFEAFDFADPSVVTGQRNVSTVAPQALYLMNHPFVLEQSQRAAERLLSETQSDDSSRIEAGFRHALGRRPLATEEVVTREFLAQVEPPISPAEAWAAVFQSLFGSIDFRYVE